MNDQLLTRRVEKILPSKKALAAHIKSKGKIRVYQGFDPTASRLHLGHTVGIRKLMDFAHEGHEVIILFGTGTVLVGDPSERDTGRKLITQEEIETNIATWKDQVAPIVDFEQVTIKQNGDWLTRMTLKDIIQIASNISAIQLFKRQSFTRRLAAGDTVWYHETMYPLLQGYDSVVMDVDLEIGGTDQEFNMLIGRELQKKMNHKDKYVLTTPMILGTDGGQMSKTTGNCVWLDDSPEDMYGKLMSIPDQQIKSYLTLLTDLPQSTYDPQDPLNSKKTLAYDIVRQFHGISHAQSAAKHFYQTVQNKQAPDQIPTVHITVSDQIGIKESVEISKKISALELAKQLPISLSNTQLKQTITQGGMQLNSQKITKLDQELTITNDDTVKFGKRNFFRIKL